MDSNVTDIAPVDLYGEVHKGLRRELFGLTAALGSATADNAAEVARLRATFDGLSVMLEAHAGHEERWVHPLIAECAPAILADLEHEHAAHEHRLAGVAAAFDRLQAANDGQSWPAAQELYRRFSEFVGHYLVHMTREEDEAMAALHEHYSDQELMEVHARLRAYIPPEDMMRFLGIMLPAMNRDERSKMLGAMRAEAPAEAFAGVCALASDVLGSDDWSALSTEVGA
jgi:hypothetical protein